MTEPSSRTPEGIPHRCPTCGGQFFIIPSTGGDACCPLCNALIWPDGIELSDEPTNTPHQHSKRISRVKSIRLRPGISDYDLQHKIKRAIDSLKSNDKVELTVLLRGREQAHADRAVQLIDEILKELVPEFGILQSTPKTMGRRVSCIVRPR